MNKDWNALTSNLGKHSVRKEFGGELPVEDVDGKLLVEFLKLFNDQFDLMDRTGYGIEDEESKKRLDKGIKETLSFISK